MAMLGLFGAIVSGIQMYPGEIIHLSILDPILYSPPVQRNFYIVLPLTLLQKYARAKRTSFDYMECWCCKYLFPSFSALVQMTTILVEK